MKTEGEGLKRNVGSKDPWISTCFVGSRHVAFSSGLDSSEENILLGLLQKTYNIGPNRSISIFQPREAQFQPILREPIR